MHYYNSNRKKIRGWKRRVKKVERWGKVISYPDLKWFEHRGYTYDRCTMSPFYMLEKRHPRLWFYRIIIAQFIAAYRSWTKVFDEMNTHFDLQLWLHDPSYIRSEIICYKVKQPKALRRFSYESDLNKPFPYEKPGSTAYDLTAFEWMLADDEEVCFEDSIDEYAGFTTQDLLDEGYVRKEQSDGVIYYAKRMGDLWIGRRKGALDTSAINEVQGYLAPPV